MSLIVNGTTIPTDAPVMANGNKVHKVIANGTVVWELEYLNPGNIVFSGEALKPYDSSHHANIGKNFDKMRVAYNNHRLMDEVSVYVQKLQVSTEKNTPLILNKTLAGIQVYKVGLVDNGHSIDFFEAQIAKGQLLHGTITPVDSNWKFVSMGTDPKINVCRFNMMTNQVKVHTNNANIHGYVQIAREGVNYGISIYIFADDGYVYKPGPEEGRTGDTIEFELLKGPKWK